MVEVVVGLETAPDVAAGVSGWLRGIGKTPLAIRGVPGFAVSRLLHATPIAAVKLVEEGVASPADP